MEKVRKYTFEELTFPKKYPQFTYKEKCKDGTERELVYDVIINEPSTRSYAVVIRNAIPKNITTALFEECKRDCILQITNRIMTKTYLQPLLNCVYSDPGITKQKYSNTEVPTIPWTPLMRELRDYVARDGFMPNSSLVNGYVLENHYVDYHSDKELRDGRDIVATVSLGGTRIFSFLKIDNKELLPSIWLNNGDLVFFYEGTNTYYKHSILKPGVSDDKSPRYSITFRVIDLV